MTDPKILSMTPVDGDWTIDINEDEYLHSDPWENVETTKKNGRIIGWALVDHDGDVKIEAAFVHNGEIHTETSYRAMNSCKAPEDDSDTGVRCWFHINRPQPGGAS